MSETDKGKVAGIRAALKYSDMDAFVAGYAVNVSKYGIFFKTARPKPMGTRVKFELKISNGETVLRGMGEVAWNREASEDNKPAGMGIKFQKLDSASRETIKKILVYKKRAGGGGSRYSEMPPPLEKAASKVALKDVDAMLANIAATQAASVKLSEKKAAKKAAEAEAAKKAAEAEAAKKAAEAEAAKKAAEAEAAKKAAEAEAAKKAAEAEAAKKAAEAEAAKKAAEAEAAKKAAEAEAAKQSSRQQAHIEADEDEIDDVIAAFDAIQMPTPEPEKAVPSAAPAPLPEGTVEASGMTDAVLDDVLFADAEDASSPNIESLVSAEDGGDADDIDALISEEVTSSSLIEDLEPETPVVEPVVSTAPPVEDVTGELDDDDLLMSVDDDDDEMMLEGDDFVVEELGEDDLVIGGDNDPEAADDSGFYDADEYAVETIENSEMLSLEAIADIEKIEGAQPPFADDLEEIERTQVEAPSGDAIDNLIDEFTRDSMDAPLHQPEPLLADNTVDNALDDLFEEERPLSSHEEQLKRVSLAPDKLPDEALPSSLAQLVEARKSIPPAAPAPQNTHASNAPAPAPAVLPPSTPLTVDDDSKNKRKKGFFGKLFNK